jgi:SNF2 family DNA or RNA helicase
MSYSFIVKESRLFCEGEGLEFLRLKTKLASFLGGRQIESKNAKSFSLSLASALFASSVFQEVYGSIPEELSDQDNLYDRHRIARNEAMADLLENKISSLEAPWPEILDPAQAVAVSVMVRKNLLGACLFDEQGIGKTVMTIAAFDVLHQRRETDSLIIVCPVTMMGGWKKEIETFLPGRYRVRIVEGSPEEKRNIILSPFDILICNFESLSGFLVTLKAVLGNKKTTLAVDESFNIKNEDASRSIATKELRSFCVRGFVMCGTPAPNAPTDIIHQFDIADSDYTFAGFTPSRDPEGLVAGITERIEERGVLIRRLKEEVLPSLPEKSFNVISISLSGRQAALYEEARGKLELKLKSMDNALFKKSLTTYFQQRAVLLQICACPEVVDPTFADDSAKVSALDKLVEDIVEKKGKKMIIWSFYRASLRGLYERYKKYSPILLDGSSTGGERAIAVQRFQSDPDVRVCIANPAAAGAGITLHAASDAAYVSFSNQAAHFLQSLDRIHRRGQTASSVNYHILVCKNTIEETEVLRLRAKEVSQHELLGDSVTWPNSLDEALAELAKEHE